MSATGSTSAAGDPRTPWGRAARAEERALDAVAANSRAAAAVAIVTIGATLALAGATTALLALAVVGAGALAFEARAAHGAGGRRPPALTLRRRRSWIAAGAAGAAIGAVTGLAQGAAADTVVGLLGAVGALLGMWLRAAHPLPASAFAAGSLGVPALFAAWRGESATSILAWLAWLALAMVLARGAARVHRALARAALAGEESEETLAVVARRLEAAQRVAEPASAGLTTTLLADSRDALVVLDADGRVVDLNRRARGLLGAGAEPGAALEPLARLIDASTRTAIDDPARQSANAGLPVRLFGEQTLLQIGDGRELNVDIRATPLDEGGVLLAIEDITEALGSSELSEWHASHDLLTGLANRAEIERRVELEAGPRGADAGPWALCYLDVEGVEAVNDAWGLHAGDAILQGLAAAMKATLRESDLLGRLGGNRFAAVLPGCPLEGALDVAEALRSTVAGHRAAGSVRLRASVGVVALGESTVAPEGPGPLAAARLAALAARDAGGDRVRAYQPDDAAVIERAELGHWLRGVREAVSTGRLRLLGQPIRPIGAGPDAATHVEVLVRVPDRDGGLTTPETFIAAAEHLGLMPEVDRWVLVRTLELMASDADLSARFEAFGVNLSAQSLGDPDFAAFAGERIAASGVDATRLVLEITETAVLVDVERAQRSIAALRALGVRFALDDFGSGQSSYARLRRLDVDVLKIDGTLVRNVAEDPAERAVVESINRVAHALGMRTVAEHVTSEEVLATLAEIGVDYAQGSAIGEPAPLVAED